MQLMFSFNSAKLMTLLALGTLWASHVALVVKNLLANAGAITDVGWSPGSGRSPGEGHDTPLEYSCLENPMDRGAWWATVHRVAKSQTRLKRLSLHALQRSLGSESQMSYHFIHKYFCI